MVAAQNDVDMQ